jgi:hypothetical protein
MTGSRKFEASISEEQEDTQTSHSEKKNKKYLINKINYINFEDKTIRITVKHKQFDRCLTFEAIPEPCSDKTLQCFWADNFVQEIELEKYDFQHLIISDDKEHIVAEPTVLEFSLQNILFELPEICHRFCETKGNSLPCKGIQVTFCQNSTVFNGELVEFSPFALQVSLQSVPPQTFQWIDQNNTVLVMLQEDGVTYYSGECNILNFRESRTEHIQIYELEPIKKQVPRFGVKEFRNIRQELTPSPDIIFIHPLTKKKVILKVKDISGSGLCVQEYLNNAQLLPGMILPEVEISFASSLRLKCCIQVVYCNTVQNLNGKECQKCGMAFLDMNIKDHLMLLSIWQQAIDGNSYICNEVNMEELWNFFFETGFIYPEKYRQMQSNKDNVKELYERLYTKNPHIARHFIYQENGTIHGHMSMVRFYQDSWMIHHHAANSTKTQWAGIKVLSQLIRYADNVHNLASTHMRYVFSYFRPDNKFPRRVLGGIAEHLNDSKKCSLDTFAYLLVNKKKIQDMPLPKYWTLEKPTTNDLFEFEYFYDDISYGLLLETLNLHSTNDLCQELANEYHKLGFKREKYIFSLKENNMLKAIYILNLSDIALNMSDLTNCLTIIIIDDTNFNEKIFYSSLCFFFAYFETNQFPVLVYPTRYVEKIQAAVEKYYTLWILDLNYIDQYITFYKKMFRNI